MMKNINTYSLFPTPVATFDYENHLEFKKNILEYCENNKEEVQISQYGKELKHFKNTPNSNLLDDIKKYSDFEDFILKSSKYFIKDIIGNEIDELVVTDCWINICGKGGHQPFHNHGNSYISGTYYLNYDSKIHSNLRFNSPFKFKDPGIQFMELNVDKYTQFNGKDVTCDFINEGMLVLWPSNLIHGYYDNSGEDRITVSMNIMPKRIKTGPYSFTVNR
jgi:uncharacterized protein (TIGR02466 family)